MKISSVAGIRNAQPARLCFWCMDRRFFFFGAGAVLVMVSHLSLI